MPIGIRVTDLPLGTADGTSDYLIGVVDGVTSRLPPPGVPHTFQLDRPAGLGWDTDYDFDGSVQIIPDGTSVATVDVTAESLFDAASTARTAPAQTYYVSTAGNDANPGTEAQPFRSIAFAIASATVAGTPTRIYVLPGSYERAYNPFTVFSAMPSVDIALIAHGGRVTTGTWDNFAAPSLDGTHANCYAITVADCNRVVDTANLTGDGLYTDLVNVSSAAICNVTPNSWNLTGGTLYVNRADRRAVTVDNTRFYRSGVASLLQTAHVNVYLGGTNPSDGWDIEGGHSSGCVVVSMSAGAGSDKVFVARNSTFRYGGGVTDTIAGGVTIASYRGLAAFFNCDASGNWVDGFAAFNPQANSNVGFLTVNCTGFDLGRGPAAQSANGWTTHDDVKGIDVAGRYVRTAGGACRSVGTSKSWLVGTSVEYDRGDIAKGGGTKPVGFMVDNTAEYWCDHTRVIGLGGTTAYSAAAVGADIHKRDVTPTTLLDFPGGTIDTY